MNLVFDKINDDGTDVLVSELKRFIREVLGCDCFTIDEHGTRPVVCTVSNVC